MPLVPAVVLPVHDALSWDVTPDSHKVVVNLQKHDRYLDSLEKFDAAAVVAFARTRSVDDVSLESSSLDGSMLRSDKWLTRLRDDVALHDRWKLRHVRTEPRA